MKFALILPFLALTLSAQQSPMDLLPKDKAGDVVRRSIAYHGGWQAWDAKRTMTFKKTTTKFKDDGGADNVRVQMHQYMMHPGPKMRMSWDDKGQKVVMVNHGWEAWKTIDGKNMPSTTDRNGARNSTFGAHYVVSMPFKLTDRGVHLKYLGTEKLNGILTDRILVTYDKGAGDAGGLHTWWYYFDAKTGRLVANMLKYDASRYDWTEYGDEKEVAGIRFPMLRTSYHADEEGRKSGAAMTSQIRYEDVRFDVALPASLFQPPSGQK